MTGAETEESQPAPQLDETLPATADETAQAVGCRIHIVGGAEIVVRQGLQVVRQRLEAAHESREAYSTFTQPSGRPIFVSPLHVRYLRQVGDPPPGEAREASACVHFVDGSLINVIQGGGVANRRLSEARASLSLFGSFSDETGSRILINCAAVSHLTSEPHDVAASGPHTP